MRAVKSIILAAGALKRQYPDEQESVLTLRAISDCNLPKFTTKDVPLFNNIISDLFPKVEPQQRDYGFLDQAIIDVSKKHHLSLKEVTLNIFILKRIKTKIIELYETI